MTESLLADFTADGYAVARGLFDPEEVDRLRDHFMGLRRRGAYANDLSGVGADRRDPLRRYPRMAQMHRWDQTSLRWLLDVRLRSRLSALAGAEPYAVQTMFYFKPPGTISICEPSPERAWPPGWRWTQPMRPTVACRWCRAATVGLSCALLGQTRRLALPTSPCRYRAARRWFRFQ